MNDSQTAVSGHGPRWPAGLLRLLRHRLDRGFALEALGPNEVRFIYDAVVGVGMTVAAWVYAWCALGQGVAWQLVVLPPALVAGNLIGGIYSRLQTAAIQVKVAVLLSSLLGTCLLGLLVAPDGSVIVLWGMLTAGPLTLPRVFCGLPYSKHTGLARRVVRQHGPVLVVGGAGYIGSHVVEQLLAGGQRVRVLDRLMYGDASLADFRGDERFELVTGDATDIGKLAAAMDGVSAVVHLAGLVGDPACAIDETFTRHANIIATRMVKDVAQSLGVHRFVFASSCSVYGTSEVEARESDRPTPVSLYAQTKVDSEREILFSVHDGFFATVLRFATVFGHSRRPRFDLVANLFVAQAMTRGEITVVGPDQWRPFIHVRDLARAVRLVLGGSPPLVQNQVYNVGDRRLNLTILQLAEAVQAVVSQEREVRITVTENPSDRRNYRVSFDRIRAHLGFEAETMIDAGIREMVREFKRGAYRDFKEAEYNNTAMTAKALAEFRDPLHTAHLYAPLAEPGSAD